MTSPFNLSIELEQSSDLTRDELDELTHSLLGEIEQDIKPESADLAREEAPPGTRGAGAITVGMIALALAPVLLGNLADLLIDWSRRNEGRKVTIVVPVGESKITIEYNPAHTKPEELKHMIADAMSAAQAGTGGQA